MNQTVLLLVFELAAVVHLMMSLVGFLYARHRIAYLPLAWVMLLFCLFYTVWFMFVCFHIMPALGILHPVMLLYLMATCYLQSVCPLGIVMPGYLQMRRMWLYATPALILIGIYLVIFLAGYHPLKIYRFDMISQLVSFDGVLRIVSLGLGVYYFINLFRLPHLLVKRHNMPRFLKAYGTITGLVSLFFIYIAVDFSFPLLRIYMLLFTLTNFYLFCRSLETIALSLPQPEINEVDEKPEMKKDEQTDFNEANRRRFEIVEFYMQRDEPWRDNLFGRDKLCEQTGINRHLMLQCLRSQGYNNIHEYINRYRVEGIRQGLESGHITCLNDCLEMGFGALKTARDAFRRMGYGSLDQYVAETLSGTAHEADLLRPLHEKSTDVPSAES
jgi:AraC-like DNA-binding protein